MPLLKLIIVILILIVHATPSTTVDTTNTTTNRSNTLRVMVIDTGIDKNNMVLMRFVPRNYETVQDRHGHGTSTTSIIASGACKELRIYPCSFVNYTYIGDSYIGSLKKIMDCIRLARRLDIDIINMSLGGYLNSEMEQFLISRFLIERETRRIVVAAGNKGEDLDKIPYYPACYKIPGLIAVGGLEANGEPSSISNKANWLRWRPMNARAYTLNYKLRTFRGTSASAAIFTNDLVREWCNNLENN